LSDRKTGTVRVVFFGICTHLTSEPGTPHRVLLVNASDQERLHRFPLLKKLDVKPHLARLQIRDEDVTGAVAEAGWLPLDPQANVPGAKVWKLDGVTLKISGAIDTASRPVVDTCIPRLSEFAPEGMAALLPPHRLDQAGELACIFDFPAVEVQGMLVPHGAAVGVIDVDLDGPAALEIQPFGGGAPISIPIRSGAEITISNIPAHGDPEQDHNADFLLHFLVTGDVPKDATFPEEPMLCAQELHTDNWPGGEKIYTGPGCSNSNYP
jgi:hypothetical protein